MISSCGHTMCSNCMNNMKTAFNDKFFVCKVCREKVSLTNIINKILYDINTEFNICIRDNLKGGKFNLMVTKDMTVKQLKEKRIKKIDFNINDILLIQKRPLNNDTKTNKDFFEFYW